MKISQELKKRIKALEEEQQRQETDLVDLDKLRDLAAISELEQELANIDETAKRMAKEEKEQGLEDIELHLDELEEQIGTPAGTQAKEGEAKHLWDVDDLLNEDKPETKARTGFVVCLMFNPKSPTEWSDEGGGGWRGKGLGTCFTNRQLAENSLRVLKQKWPDYPIEIKPVDY